VGELLPSKVEEHLTLPVQHDIDRPAKAVADSPQVNPAGEKLYGLLRKFLCAENVPPVEMPYDGFVVRNADRPLMR
jgi:hypothetical protein